MFLVVVVVSVAVEVVVATLPELVHTSCDEPGMIQQGDCHHCNCYYYTVSTITLTFTLTLTLTLMTTTVYIYACTNPIYGTIVPLSCAMMAVV